MKMGGVTIREVYVRWIGIFVLAYVMSLIHGVDPGETRLQKYATAWIFTCTYWNAAFLMFMHFRKVYPEIKQTPRRLLVTALTLASFMVIVDPLLCTVFNINQDHDVFSLSYILPNSAINLSVAGVIGSVYENCYFFEQWRTSI